MRNSKGQFVKGQVGWNTGMKGYTNAGSFKKGHLPIFISLESRKEAGIKISKIRKGMKFTKKHCKNLGKAHKNSEIFQKAVKSEKRNNKISKANSGNKSHFWKGGIFTYERKLYLNEKRRARKLNAEGSHIFEEWLELKAKCDYTCPCCGEKEPEIKLTEDHIVPLSKGGSDYIENIQPLCRSCNCKKYNKIKKYEF